MKQNSHSKTRYFTLVLLLCAGLIIGLATPLFLDSERIDFNFDGAGVVASPRDHYQVGNTVLVHPFTQLYANGGQLIQDAPEGKKLTGQEALSQLRAGTANLVLKDASLTFAAPPDGSEPSEVALSEVPSAPLMSALSQLKFASLKIANGRIAVRLPSGGVERLFAVNLEVKQRRRTAITAKGTAIWRGQEVSLDIVTSPLSSSGLEMPVRFLIKGPLMTVNFEGQLRRSGELQLVGNVGVSVPDLRALAWSRGAELPGSSGLKTFALEGPVRWTKDTLAFDAVESELDGNKAKGTIALKSLEGSPKLSGTLAFNTLDLTPYIFATQSQPTDDVASWWQFASRAWAMPLVRYFDADLRLSAKETVVGESRLGKAAATVAINSGKLSAQLARLVYDGGEGSGQVTIDYNNLIPKGAIHGRLINAPLGDLASSMFGARSIEGRADVTADLRTQGIGWRAMRDSLNGSLKLDLNKGGALGFNFAPLLAASQKTGQLAEVKQMLRDAARGTTQLSSLNVDVEVKYGKARSKKIVAYFDDRVLKLAGNLDFSAESVALRGILHENVNREPGDEAAKSEKSIAAHTIKMGGTFDSMSIDVQERQGRPSVLADEVLNNKPAVLRSAP